MDQRIILNTTRKDLVALYDRRGTIDPFRSPHTRPYRRAFLWAMVAASILVVLGLGWDVVAWFLVWAAIIVIGAVVMVLYAFSHTLRARTSVHRWAKEAEDAGEAVLVLSSSGFILHYKGSEYITKWNAVKRVELHEDYVLIVANDERLYPRSSMRPEEFQTLSDMLRMNVLDRAASTESSETNS